MAQVEQWSTIWAVANPALRLVLLPCLGPRVQRTGLIEPVSKTAVSPTDKGRVSLRNDLTLQAGAPKLKIQ